MSVRYVFFVLIVFPFTFAIAGSISFPSKLSDTVVNSGKQYRDAVAVVINDENAEKNLQGILAREPADSVNARQIRILLARIHYPDVFSEFDKAIQMWRKSELASVLYKRPGALFSLLRRFVMRGPESRYVDERIGWQRTSLGSRPAFKQIEKYTDIEVAAGIARNAAARQVVLEHFLKFLDEGDAYEQGELIMIVDHLWGGNRRIHRGDLAVVDHVSDAESLIEAIFCDASRPLSVRMCAVSSLPNAEPVKVQALMLNVITNTPSENLIFYSESMVGSALYRLESLADANTLAALRGYTNAPVWKREKIEKTIHVIDSRLSETSKDE